MSLNFEQTLNLGVKDTNLVGHGIARQQVFEGITRLISRFAPETQPPGRGFYSGSPSVSLLLYRLSRLYGNVEYKGVSLRAWADRYAHQTLQSPTLKSSDIKDHGIAQWSFCRCAMTIVLSRPAPDPRKVFELMDRIMMDGSQSSDWFNGRAGFLYVLRLIRHTYEADDPSALTRRKLIDEIAENVIRAIRANSMPCTARGETYVGAAHGITGIVTQVVLTSSRFASAFEPELKAILDSQYSNGNWPRTLPDSRGIGGDRDNPLIQFCHGATGVVTSLHSMRPHFPRYRTRIDAAIRAGRALIQRAGPPKHKDRCLCHGISGNALALDGGDGANSEPSTEFIQFIARTTQRAVDSAVHDEGLHGVDTERSEGPAGLYTGEAGRIWTWAVLDRGLSRRFLGYNDI
jgi:AcrR family transcriptional regulator